MVLSIAINSKFSFRFEIVITDFCKPGFFVKFIALSLLLLSTESQTLLKPNSLAFLTENLVIQIRFSLTESLSEILDFLCFGKRPLIR